MKQFLFVIGLVMSLASWASAVTGSVFVDKNNNGLRDKNEVGIQDVSVSNQVVVVKTNSEGFYQLDISSESKFIFISLPSGFTTKNWWQKLSTEAIIDFPMTVTPPKSGFTFIHASDTHLSERSLDRMKRLLEIVNVNKPDFVMITGDLVRDALRVSEKEASGYYQLYVNELRKFSTPVWNVPGNHENFGIERHLSLVSKDHPLYGKKMYHHYLGPNYYSFNYGGIHFVGLDDVDFEDLFYYGHVDSVQFNWLKQDLAAVPLSTPVITFNHIPFYSGGLSMTKFTEEGLSRTLERENGVLQFRHVVSNADELVDLISTHPYPIALSGHYHARQVFWRQTEGQITRFEQTSAVVGPDDEGNQIVPSGVTLYTVKDGKIDEGKFIVLDKK